MEFSLTGVFPQRLARKAWGIRVRPLRCGRSTPPLRPGTLPDFLSGLSPIARVLSRGNPLGSWLPLSSSGFKPHVATDERLLEVAGAVWPSSEFRW